MQILKELFPINAAGDKRAGILILPDDYSTNPDPLPLIVFSHGVGEAGFPDANGKATLGKVDDLYNNGSPLAVARDGGLSKVLCPITGRTYRFAVLGLQGLTNSSGQYGWCVRSADTVGALQLLFKRFPQLAGGGIAVMGLSAGGENTWELAGGPNASMFIAACPMSSAAPDTATMKYAAITAKVWAMHGTQDGTCPYSISVGAVNGTNGGSKGRAYLETTADGHGGWDREFNPSTRYVLPGVASGKAINRYEFVLACLNSNVSFTASGTEAGAGGTTPNTVVTKAVAAARLNADKTITLDASGTTGNVTSWKWDYTVPAGVEKPWYVEGRGDGGPALALRTLQNVKPGTWVFTLHVWNGSAETIDTATVIVDAAGGGKVVTPPVTTKKKVGSIYVGDKTVNVFDDLSTEIV